jgi:carboxymethylenebutenolidase
MKSTRRRHTDLLVPALCAVQLVLSGHVSSQTPQPNRPQTWADEQKAQAWATVKLNASPRHNEWVDVPTQGHRRLKTWVEFPEYKRQAPVVLFLHEVFGLTDSTRNTADEIAAMGFIVVVPDMLSGFGPGGGGTESFANSRLAAQTLVGLKTDVVNSDLNALADSASRLHGSNGKLAVVGLSWGGGAAFRYATTQRSDVKAVFVFYDVGPPATGQGIANDARVDIFPVAGIRVPVYGFYADRDTRVMASLNATKEAMSAAGKAYDPVIYRGADHAYMRIGEDPADRNPANAAAVKASLARLRALFGKVLQ